MSWSASIVIPKGTSAEDANSMVTAMTITDQSVEAQAAFNAARACLNTYIATSNVAGPTDPFISEITHSISLSISGHNNPGNNPTEGMGNDYITASIYQLTEPVVSK